MNSPQHGSVFFREDQVRIGDTVSKGLVVVIEETAFKRRGSQTPELLDARISQALAKLASITSGTGSPDSRLRAWSRFIRLRDNHRCVACHGKSTLAAHHICRKSFLPEARFQTGNGITLCRNCHQDVHAGFNGRPDLQLPMDAQGGEKVETMVALYGALLEDALERGILQDDLYFLGDAVLAKFKLFQGFDPYEKFPGRRLEQAYAIWRACPQDLMNALLKANSPL